ncbi:homeodomain-containing protein [Herbaspirillum sp. SJZ099]|nr:homeodomain-containing protein [Herbaspirillum sp. SJZ099]
MPWRTVDIMSLREEFTNLARQEDANISLLCERFGISRKTGYKLLNRVAEEGRNGLADRSRRPLNSPARTHSEIETRVIELRHQHPAWGARKLHRRLLDLGHEGIPSPSTITRILQRNGLIDAQASADSTPFQRFEHARPNELWQMDFKGHFETGAGTCHPLTIIDDHSRYNITLTAVRGPIGRKYRRRWKTCSAAMACPCASTPTTVPSGGAPRNRPTASRN